MIINPIQAVAIIEENGIFLAQVEQQTTEPAVKPLQKSKSLVLIQVDKCTRVLPIKQMPSGNKLGYIKRFDETLAGEDQANVLRFVPDRQTVRKRSTEGGPTHANPKCPIEVSPRSVEPLVDHAFAHRLEHGRIVAAGFLPNNSGDSGH